MNGPRQLDPSEIVAFIARPEPAVVLLAAHPVLPFNPRLCERFAEDGGTRVAFARVSVTQLLSSASAPRLIERLLREAADCGAPLPLGVAPGYYLFRAGRMLAWDSGLPATADLVPVLRGALPWMLLSVALRNPTILRTALWCGIEEAAAARAESRFRDASAARRERPGAGSAAGGADELAAAYRLLGVGPDASDAEVHRAWRELLRRHHPDRGAQDPQECARRSRLCMEINRARDTIRRHRGQRGKG